MYFEISGHHELISALVLIFIRELVYSATTCLREGDDSNSICWSTFLQFYAAMLVACGLVGEGGGIHAITLFIRLILCSRRSCSQVSQVVPPPTQSREARSSS